KASNAASASSDSRTSRSATSSKPISLKKSPQPCCSNPDRPQINVDEPSKLLVRSAGIKPADLLIPVHANRSTLTGTSYRENPPVETGGLFRSSLQRTAANCF